MRSGQVYVFFGRVQKFEKLKNGRYWRVLLIDLAKEIGNPIIDDIWVDLPIGFDPKEVKLQSILRFQATVKSFSVKNYYDYHEREMVQLRPVCKLTNISNIQVEQKLPN